MPSKVPSIANRPLMSELSYYLYSPSMLYCAIFVIPFPRLDRLRLGRRKVRVKVIRELFTFRWLWQPKRSKATERWPPKVVAGPGRKDRMFDYVFISLWCHAKKIKKKIINNKRNPKENDYQQQTELQFSQKAFVVHFSQGGRPKH